MKKKLTALLLALGLIVGMFPAIAYAEEPLDEQEPTTEAVSASETDEETVPEAAPEAAPAAEEAEDEDILTVEDSEDEGVPVVEETEDVTAPAAEDGEPQAGEPAKAPMKTPVAPANVRWDGKVARWDAVEGATSYNVSLWKVDMTQLLTTEVNELSIDFTETIDANGSGVYGFRVAAVTSDGNSEMVFASDPLICYTLTVKAYPEEGGTVTGSGVYVAGSSVTITAAPAEGYALSWYYTPEELEDDLANGRHQLPANWPSTTKTVEVQGDEAIVARFEKVHTVTLDMGGRGGNIVWENTPEFFPIDTVLDDMVRDNLDRFSESDTPYYLIAPKPKSSYSSPSQALADKSSTFSHDKYVTEDITAYVIWRTVASEIAVTVTPPVCGASTTTEKSSSGRWQWEEQTNRPIVTASGDGDNVDSTYWDEDEDGYDPFIGTFVGGQSYFVEVYLTPNWDVFTEDTTVTVNGATLSDSEVKSYEGWFIASVTAVHDWGDWEVVKEPTETETGLRQRTCKGGCGETETEVIPALGVEEEETVAYEIIEGADATWTKGSDDTLTFVSNAPFDKFVTVLVDGKELSESDYAAESGSTRITLKAAYLETLAVGSHTIEIQSSDGSAATTFKVLAAAADADDPEDNTDIKDTDAPEDNTDPEDTGVPEDNTDSEDTDAPEDNNDPEDTDVPEDNTDPEDTDAPEDNTDPEDTDAPEDNTDTEDADTPEDGGDTEDTGDTQNSRGHSQKTKSAKKGSKTPKTGDDSSLLLWSSVMAAAALGACVVVFTGKRKARK